MINQITILILSFTPVFLFGQGIAEEKRELLPFAHSLLSDAKTLIGKHDPEIALKKLDQAKDIFERELGDRSKEAADCWHQIGRSFHLQRDINSAEKSWKKAVSIRLEVFGKTDTLVASSMTNLGMCYKLQADYKKAAEYYDKALKIYLASLGESNLKTVKTLMNLADIYSLQGHYDQANTLQEKGVKTLSNLKITPTEKATVLNNTGANYFRQGKYNKAIDSFEKALKIRIKEFGELNILVASSYMNIGNSLIRLGKYDLAIKYHKKVLSIKTTLLGETDLGLASSYNGLGVINTIIGKYDKAIQLHEKALNIKLKVLPSTHQGIARSYANLGAVYKELENYVKANELYHKALEIQIETLGKSHPSVAITYNNLGNIYGIQENYPESISTFKKALTIQSKKLDKFHPELGRTFGNLGNVYFNQGDYQKAIHYYTKSLNIREKELGLVHPDVASSYKSLGEVYKKLNDFDTAEQYYDKAITSLNYSGLESLNKVNSMPFLINNLQLKGEINQYKYLETNDIRALYAGKHWVTQAISTLDFQTQTNFEYNKYQLAKKAHLVYETAISIHYHLFQLTDSIHYLKEAFAFSEKTKSYFLYKAIQESSALSFAGIPDSLLERELDLRSSISYQDKLYREKVMQGLTESDTTVLDIKRKNYELKIKYEALKTTFEKEYPDYHQLKYDLKTVDLNKIQKEMLEVDQTLLEYFVGDSAIFIFVISTNNCVVHKLPKDFPLEKWIREMRDGIYSYPLSNTSNETAYQTGTSKYIKSAHQLFLKLIEPSKNLLTSKLIIIPDGVLGYIPFDALLREKPSPDAIFSFKHYDYLWRDHQISYCYSATLLDQMEAKKNNPSRMLLAIAPIFKNHPYKDQILHRTRLDSLRNNISEAYTVQQVIGQGTLLLRQEATKQNFSNLAPDYQIVHLSTHSKADDKAGDYSYLAFTGSADSTENEFLYNKDLYNISLNAEMVVLSACETGVGELQKGEGIISLARGFSYAGAKSIISTLWSVDDARTVKLMNFFYQNIKENMPKDEALHQAKKDFIDDNYSEYAHPFFWASFIPIGDMGSIKFERSTNWRPKLFIGCLLIGFTMIFTYAKYKT